MSKVQCFCLTCNKEFYVQPNQIKFGKGKYCSRKCLGQKSFGIARDMSGENNPNWKGGMNKSEITQRYREKYPEKYLAHRLMRNAIRKKDIIPLPCEVCGKEKVEGHHEDYSKPLDIIWLCKKHHLEAHKGRFH